MAAIDIDKKAQELATAYDLDLEFCKLYLEEFSEMFTKCFRFTAKDIEVYADRLFSTRNEEAIEYFHKIFTKFCDLEAANKNLTELEAYNRRKYAQSIIKKAYAYLIEDGEQIKQSFFDALKQAEQFGIDPYKISNKSTFRRLTDERLTEILNTLQENIYVDINTEKEFRLFENIDDFKQIFEECSSEIVQINHKKVQDILQILSDFTFDKETGTFYGNVDYIKMVRVCKSLLTQNVDTLKETIKFLEDTFVDKNDPTSKIALLKKVEACPSILLLNPEKVASVRSELIKHGVDADTASKFCLNLDNLIQIDSITSKELKYVGDVKSTLSYFYGEENAKKALTRVEYIKTHPLVLKVLLQRAAKQGLLEKLLKNPSALNSSFTVVSTGNGGHGGERSRHTKQSAEEKFAPLPHAMLDEYDYNAALTRLPDTDKKYIQEVLDKLNGNAKQKPAKSPDEPKKPSTHSGEKTERAKRIRPLPTALAEQLAAVDTDDRLPLAYRIIKKFEIAIDFKKGKGYAERKFHLNQVKQNCKLALDIDVSSQKIVEDEKFFKSCEIVLKHILSLASPKGCDDLLRQIKASKSRNIDEFVFPRNFEKAIKYVADVLINYSAITDKQIALANKNDALLPEEKNFTIVDPWLAETNIFSYLFSIVGKEAAKLYGDRYSLLIQQEAMMLQEVKHSPYPTLAYFACDTFMREYSDAWDALCNHISEKNNTIKLLQGCSSYYRHDDYDNEIFKLGILMGMSKHLREKKLTCGICHPYRELSEGVVKTEEENGEQVQAVYFDHKDGYTLRYQLPQEDAGIIEKLKHPVPAISDFTVVKESDASMVDKHIVHMDSDQRIGKDLAAFKALTSSADGEGK